MAERVLIVDDELSVLKLTEFHMQLAGFETAIARSGTEALAKIAGNPPDLVILDNMMPAMSGREVCERIRHDLGLTDLPIVMLSALGEVRDKIGGLKAGADEYVVKPVDMDELVVRVSALLERTQRLKRPIGPARGKQITFIGARGGVGTTTVALNASALIAQSGKSVIAAELSAYGAAFALQLKTSPLQNLAHLRKLDVDQINQREVTATLHRMTNGMGVLFGPQRPEEYGELDPERAVAVLEQATQMAEYVVVDLPSGLTLTAQAVARQSDRVALVVEPEANCIDSAKMAVELLKHWGIGSGLLSVIVVNRGGLTATVSLREIGSQLGCEIIGMMPAAGEACAAASARGMPLALYAPNQIASSTLAEMTNRIVSNSVVGIRL